MKWTTISLMHDMPQFDIVRVRASLELDSSAEFLAIVFISLLCPVPNLTIQFRQFREVLHSKYVYEHNVFFGKIFVLWHSFVLWNRWTMLSALELSARSCCASSFFKKIYNNVARNVLPGNKICRCNRIFKRNFTLIIIRTKVKEKCHRVFFKFDKILH